MYVSCAWNVLKYLAGSRSLHHLDDFFHISNNESLTRTSALAHFIDEDAPVPVIVLYQFVTGQSAELCTAKPR